ncbi:hypothetical protein AB1Y20_000580 [Prymnesium parvum]|uniref:Uncharacterized protein n=1 Tax=Prymnesium parvum TaxID=97485 RepID=A0AB34K575_PRYPA|mmetsp:Transcript_7021/g.17565  ORF Transcript_7021/g.17565 Transcript_7021/m.17565 type:complete len:139 (-) Transcript_7021:152-568(-)
MDGTDEEIIERMRDNAEAFEQMTDNTDDRVNDGNNYRGLMKASEYKAKREAVVAGNVSEETLADRKLAAAAAMVIKDREAKEQAEKDRQQREADRREKLKRELEEIEEADSSTGSSKKVKKKKKKEAGALSFDLDDEA